MKKNATLMALMLFLILAGLAAAPGGRESARIEFLMRAVEGSGATFIRNGTEYSAGEAAAHLRLKMSKAGQKISTAEQFIDYLASKSSLSGKPYYLKLKDGSKTEARVWLHQKLKQFK